MRTLVIASIAAWLPSCAPKMATVMPETSTDPVTGALDARAAIAEVEQLHAFFARWFRGELPETGEAFSRFERALAPEFEMVPPSGVLLRRDQVLAGVRGTYGSWKGDEAAAIEVRHATARPVGNGVVLVSYEEWQRRDGVWKARRSTALLRAATGADSPADAVEWIHVHETWMASDG